MHNKKVKRNSGNNFKNSCKILTFKRDQKY